MSAQADAGTGPVALITGATSGIGLTFARRYARDGHDLVLVARDEKRLNEVADELRSTYGRQAEVLRADLSDRAQLQAVADRLADRSRPVDVLVNNAGFALNRGFLAADVADEERLLDVLCRAVLVLSHAAGLAMRDRRRGTIVNVSSVSGFVAMGTYSAAKAWVTTFSEGLWRELKPYGVHVTALCPGFTHTEFHQRASITMSRLPGIGWLDVDEVVDDCLADVRRGRVVSVPSTRYKALVLAIRHVPRAMVRNGSGAVSRRRNRTD
jgi:short-subunit dehydrogenase